MKTPRRVIGLMLLGILCVSSSASAQRAAPEARGFGLATSYSARATGHEASFWNPANLGLSRNPDWSVGLNASAYFSNNALGYGQITDLYGEYLDAAEKSRLLADVRDATGGDPMTLAFDVGAQGLGASFGRFAAGIGGIGAGNAELTPDALELLLFGNVGETGEGRNFNFDDTSANIWSLYGGYVSYAQPFRFDALPDAGFSVGGTIRAGVAQDLTLIRSSDSQLIYEPLALEASLEKIQSSTGNAGNAVTVDLGLAMEWGERIVAGVALINAFKKVSWDESAFSVTRYDVDATYTDIAVTSTTQRFEDLSAAEQDRVRDRLDESTLPRSLQFGSLYQFSPRIDLSVDYAELIGGDLRSRWNRILSTGSEFRLMPWMPLRAGVATSFEQFGLTGGLGLYGGPLHFDFAIGRWGFGGGDGIVTALSVSYWPGGI